MNQSATLLPNKKRPKNEDPKRVLLQAEPKNNVIGDLIGIDQILAESKISIRNWKIPNGDSLFPVHPLMRTVDKYFPYASGGPLLVDEPSYPDDTASCEKKGKLLRELGYRYLVLTKETDLQSAALQLMMGAK